MYKTFLIELIRDEIRSLQVKPTERDFDATVLAIFESVKAKAVIPSFEHNDLRSLVKDMVEVAWPTINRKPDY